jgi:hypothetical protein
MVYLTQGVRTLSQNSKVGSAVHDLITCANHLAAVLNVDALRLGSVDATAV